MNTNNDFKILELSAFKVTGLSIVLTWKWVSNGKEIGLPANVSNYRIYCDGKEFDENVRPSNKHWYFYLDKLTYNTKYKAYIRAFDDANHALVKSNEIEVTTKERPRWSLFNQMPIEGQLAGNWVGATGYFWDDGLDLHAVINTPCYAIETGKVKSDYDSDVGHRVIISIIDKKIKYGDFMLTTAFYTHLSKEKKAENGIEYEKGELIGLSFYPPKEPHKPHLHFGFNVDRNNTMFKMPIEGEKNLTYSAKELTRDEVYEVLNLSFDQILRIPYFSDVPCNHWANTYIKTEKHGWQVGKNTYIDLLQRNGYISGKDKYNYDPAGSLTRAEMAVLSLKGHYGPSFKPTSTKIRFKDVGENEKKEWYFKWVNESAEKGFSTGYPDGNYYPNKAVTRAEATVYFLRVKMGPTYKPSQLDPSQIPIEYRYEDVNLEQWYSKWIYTAIINKIGVNCDEPNRKQPNRFRPNAELSRAEAACMMFQTLQAMKIIPKDL